MYHPGGSDGLLALCLCLSVCFRVLAITTQYSNAKSHPQLIVWYFQNNDRHHNEAQTEADVERSPSALRSLFAVILTMYEPSDSFQLWTANQENPSCFRTLAVFVVVQRRRTIKQAMTFYKILNNIIEIKPPPPTCLLTRSHNRHLFTIPRSRLNSVVYSFYPRDIRIWNTIPKEITEIKQPDSFHAAISKLPFTTPTSLKCL